MKKGIGKVINRKNVIKFTIFVTGLFVSGLGVAITKKGELGVSPVSSVANVMSIYIPELTLGNWLIIWNCTLILAQIIILRKKFRVIQFLQLPLSFAFGYFTDIGAWLVKDIPADNYVARLAFAVVGTIVLGTGVATTVRVNLIMNSGEALVKAVSDTWGKNFGNVKIAFDIACVVISIIMSMAFFHMKIVGTREGTVIAALFTGVVVKFVMKRFDRMDLRRWKNAD